MDGRTATATDALRWLRAGVLAALALLTALVAHASSGGTLPTTTALVALFGLVTVAVGTLLRHPASTRRVVLLLAAGETCVHTALSVLTTEPGSSGSSAQDMHLRAGPMSGMGPMADGHLSGDHATHVSGWVAHVLSGVSGPHILMAETHLVAAMLLGLWLAAGERALWTLLCLTFRPVAVALAALLNAHTPLYSGKDAGLSMPASMNRERLSPHLWAQACQVVTRRGPPEGSGCTLGT
jgi:hypothetical protein